MTNELALLAQSPLVSSSKTKPCRFSSVQLRRSVRGLSIGSLNAGIIILFTSGYATGSKNLRGQRDCMLKGFQREERA